jgi:hypothetical protein
MRAWLNLRHTQGARADAFHRGVQALGFEAVDGLTDRPGPADVLVTWNRIGEGHRAAMRFAAAGRPVLVAENATWGNRFAGDEWLTIARNWHNTAGCFPIGGPERWDDLGVELAPWRTCGETVVLPQRGIGPPGVAMPAGWSASGRVRRHPGRRDAVPLEVDLAHAGKVITWGSGAAVRALLRGIPVESHMPNWIAAQDNTDAGRLAMFRRLAWANWRLSEIADGVPFRRLLS